MKSNLKKDLSFFKNKKLLLCISGGIDSIFLYHNIIGLQSKYNFKIGVAHVNYNTSLISNNSTNLCRELSISNNHPFYLKIYNHHPETNFEHLAREVRYSFFDSIKRKEKYDYILTAHNKNDLLETLYMQQGIDDFSIFPYSKSNACISRPLIHIDRQEIKKYINDNDCLYYDDPTNLEPKYKRNHIRMNIFPKLKDRDDLFKKLLNNYHLKVKKYKETCLEFDKNKDKFIIHDKSSNMIKIDINYIRTLDPYSFKLLFQGLINREFDIQVNKTKKYWKELYRQLMLPDKNILFNVHHFLSIYSDLNFLYISLIDPPCYSKRIVDKLRWDNGEFIVTKHKKIEHEDLNNKNIFICSEKIYNQGLFVRKWFKGDKILTSNNHRKLISDLFNEYKVLPFLRYRKPIIIQDGKILWIPGIEISQNNYLMDNDLIKIEWNEIRK